MVSSMLLAATGCKTTAHTNSGLKEDGSYQQQAASFEAKLTAGNDSERRLKIDKIEQNNRGIDSIRIEAREYVFSRPYNPFGSATYEASDSKRVKLVCTNLSGTNVNRLTVESGSFLSVTVESEYTVQNCSQLAQALKNLDISKSGKDLLLSPSASRVSIVDEYVEK